MAARACARCRSPGTQLWSELTPRSTWACRAWLAKSPAQQRTSSPSTARAFHSINQRPTLARSSEERRRKRPKRSRSASSSSRAPAAAAHDEGVRARPSHRWVTRAGAGRVIWGSPARAQGRELRFGALAEPHGDSAARHLGSSATRWVRGTTPPSCLPPFDGSQLRQRGLRSLSASLPLWPQASRPSRLQSPTRRSVPAQGPLRAAPRAARRVVRAMPRGLTAGERDRAASLGAESRGAELHTGAGARVLTDVLTIQPRRGRGAVDSRISALGGLLSTTAS